MPGGERPAAAPPSLRRLARRCPNLEAIDAAQKVVQVLAQHAAAGTRRHPAQCTTLMLEAREGPPPLLMTP